MAAPMKNVLGCLRARFCTETGIFNMNRARISLFNRTQSHRNLFTFRNNLFTKLQAPKGRKIALLTAGVSLTALYLTGLSKRTHNLLYADGGGPPKYKPIRKIRSDTDTTGLKLTLFQYQTCPFCCKVRAYLDYHGFSYDVIEVNSVWRTQTKWTKYKKVPILVCHGMGEDGFLQMNDSSVIISALETFLVDKTQPLDKILTYYPSMEAKNHRGKTVLEFPNRYFIMYMDRQDIGKTAEQGKEEREWRTWVDDWFVHTLSPNIYRTPSEAVTSFQYFSKVGEWEKVFSTPERLTVIYMGSIAMYFVGKMLKKRYSLKDDVRSSLFDACDKWAQAVGHKRRFMGGKVPNLADLSMYGVLSAIEGCNAFKEILQHTSIGPWYYRVQKLVQFRGGEAK